MELVFLLYVDAEFKGNDKMVSCLGRYQTANPCYYGFVAMGTDANGKEEGTSCIFIQTLHKYFIYSCIPGVREKQIQIA